MEHDAEEPTVEDEQMEQAAKRRQSVSFNKLQSRFREEAVGPRISGDFAAADFKLLIGGSRTSIASCK